MAIHHAPQGLVRSWGLLAASLVAVALCATAWSSPAPDLLTPRVGALVAEVEALRDRVAEMEVAGPAMSHSVCTWDLVHSPDSKGLREDIAIDCRPRCLVTKVVRLAEVSP